MHIAPRVKLEAKLGVEGSFTTKHTLKKTETITIDMEKKEIINKSTPDRKYSPNFEIKLNGEAVLTGSLGVDIGLSVCAGLISFGVNASLRASVGLKMPELKMTIIGDEDFFSLGEDAYWFWKIDVPLSLYCEIKVKSGPIAAAWRATREAIARGGHSVIGEAAKNEFRLDYEFYSKTLVDRKNYFFPQIDENSYEFYTPGGSLDNDESRRVYGEVKFKDVGFATPSGLAVAVRDSKNQLAGIFPAYLMGHTEDESQLAIGEIKNDKSYYFWFELPPINEEYMAYPCCYLGDLVSPVITKGKKFTTQAPAAKISNLEQIGYELVKEGVHRYYLYFDVALSGIDRIQYWKFDIELNYLGKLVKRFTKEFNNKSKKHHFSVKAVIETNVPPGMLSIIQVTCPETQTDVKGNLTSIANNKESLFLQKLGELESWQDMYSTTYVWKDW